MHDRLNFLAIEPYYGLSHRMFIDGYRSYSRHDVEIWGLPPRKWKWRMRGSAYHFTEKIRNHPPARKPDLIFASDYLNLANWKALCPREYRDIPCVLYFHENQICYPLGDHAPVDYQYGWMNLNSALAADRILFNSSYQRELFIKEVAKVFQRMPDFVPKGIPERIRSNSSVFPVGIDFAPHEKQLASHEPHNHGAPVILWNHRWEYDKDPERFVDALLEIADRGVDYRVVICGESFGKMHPSFEKLEKHRRDRILHMGFLPSANDYREVVMDCDIVISTARHEFFGVSVIEAIFLGCLPVLPNALSYPEIIPPHLHPLFLYRDEPLDEFLESFLARPPVEYKDELRTIAAKYHWKNLAPHLDEELENVLRTAS